MREISYRPQNIRETLVELKDTSELAVDLAYSAVLFDNHDLAEEVVSLASRVSFLRYHARIALMLAAKNTNDAEELVGLFQVVDGSVDITEAAADLAQITLRGFGIPPAFRAFSEAEERFVRLILTESAPLDGQTLADLALDVEHGIRIIARRRDDEWLFAPEGDDVIQAGDVLFARGPEEGIAAFHETATGTAWERPAVGETSEAIGGAIETVVELKDISELAVALSYSAALYDDEMMAEEVVELENRTDELRQELESWVVADEHTDTSPDGRRGLFHLAIAAENIADSALDIAEVVFRDVTLHPVFGQAIRESREVITSIQIGEESPLRGRTITEFEHDIEAGMTALALRRAGNWLYDPDEAMTLQPEDTLILQGPSRGRPRVQELAND